MTSSSNYSQNFLSGSFLVGNHRLSGKTKGILLVIREAPPKGTPVGVKEQPKLKAPEFELDRDLIITRHIKVKWSKEPLYVDTVFLGNGTSDEDIIAEAKLIGYREVVFLKDSEIILLD